MSPSLQCKASSKKTSWNLKMANSREFQLHSTIKCPPKVTQNEVKLFSCSSCHEWQIKQPQKESAMIWLFHSPVSQAFAFCLLFQWILPTFFFLPRKTFSCRTMKPFFCWWKKIHWCKRKQEKSPIPEKKKQQAKGTSVTLAPPCVQLHSPCTSTIAASSSASPFFKLSIGFYLIIHFMSFAFPFFLSLLFESLIIVFDAYTNGRLSMLYVWSINSFESTVLFNHLRDIHQMRIDSISDCFLFCHSIQITFNDTARSADSFLPLLRIRRKKRCAGNEKML